MVKGNYSQTTCLIPAFICSLYEKSFYILPSMEELLFFGVLDTDYKAMTYA